MGRGGGAELVADAVGEVLEAGLVVAERHLGGRVADDLPDVGRGEPRFDGEGDEGRAEGMPAVQRGGVAAFETALLGHPEQVDLRLAGECLARTDRFAGEGFDGLEVGRDDAAGAIGRRLDLRVGLAALEARVGVEDAFASVGGEIGGADDLADLFKVEWLAHFVLKLCRCRCEFLLEESSGDEGLDGFGDLIALGGIEPSGGREYWAGEASAGGNLPLEDLFKSHVENRDVGENFGLAGYDADESDVKVDVFPLQVADVAEPHAREGGGHGQGVDDRVFGGEFEDAVELGAGKGLVRNFVRLVVATEESGEGVGISRGRPEVIGAGQEPDLLLDGLVAVFLFQQDEIGLGDFRRDQIELGAGLAVLPGHLRLGEGGETREERVGDLEPIFGRVTPLGQLSPEPGEVIKVNLGQLASGGLVVGDLL